MRFSRLLSSGIQAEGAGISPWLWILILLVVVVFVVWLLTRNRPSQEKKETDVDEKPAAAAEPVETKAAMKPPFQDEDDLTKIEGIGPKTRQVFNQAGISTFNVLSGKSVQELQDILDEANLTLADPGTWPEQAKMAADGHWDELAEYQEELKGGR